MDQQQIAENLRLHADFADEEIDEFFALGESLTVKKNKVIVKAGDDPTKVILIKSGCLMTYLMDEQNAMHVLQFGIEMWWTGDLEGFTNDKPSMYSVKAITDSEIYIFDKQSYHQLFQRVPKFERYFRRIFQNSLVVHQRRIIGNISYSGEQKYLEFKKRYPKLEIIVPQKYIASYIGITPEFLSKLRRRLAGR